MTAWKITYRQAMTWHNVEAEYYKLEDGWFTFKTADHKAVLTANAEDVISVARIEEKPAESVRANRVTWAGPRSAPQPPDRQPQDRREYTD